MKKLFIIFIFLFFISCENKEEKKKKDADFQKHIKTKNSIRKIIDKYNPVIDSLKDIDSLLYPTFTITIEKALIREDDRPILIFVSVEDVKKKNNKYIAHFINYQKVFKPDILYILECKKGDINIILSNKNYDYDINYAIIAKISDIKKIDFKINTEFEYDEGIYLYVNSSDDFFIAKGKCINLLYIPKYTPSDITNMLKPERINNNKRPWPKEKDKKDPLGLFKDKEVK